jgi:hypothetical protein
MIQALSPIPVGILKRMTTAAAQNTGQTADQTTFGQALEKIGTSRIRRESQKIISRGVVCLPAQEPRLRLRTK